MRPCWRHPQRVLVVPVHAMESLSCQKPVKAAMNLMKVVVVGVEVALDALQKRQCQPVSVVAAQLSPWTVHSAAPLWEAAYFGNKRLSWKMVFWQQAQDILVLWQAKIFCC